MESHESHDLWWHFGLKYLKEHENVYIKDLEGEQDEDN